MERLIIKNRGNGGLTLIEVLLYIALFGLFIGGAVLASMENISSISKGKTSAMIEGEGDFLLSKFQWALAGSSSITTPSYRASSTQLSVTMRYPESLESNPITFSQGGQNILITKGTEIPSVLNNSNVTTSHLSFFYQDASKGKLKSLEVSFTLSARSDDGVVISQLFSSTHYFEE